MSEVSLSASVRQNLLSLQNTTKLLASTQQRISTGKKVNSALDGPSSFFTAQGLSNRAANLTEESANMLALQLRQQLTTQSLSIASSSAQSILSLFR